MQQGDHSEKLGDRIKRLGGDIAHLKGDINTHVNRTTSVGDVPLADSGTDIQPLDDTSISR